MKHVNKRLNDDDDDDDDDVRSVCFLFLSSLLGGVNDGDHTHLCLCAIFVLFVHLRNCCVFIMIDFFS